MLVNSTFADGTSGVRNIGFGGSANLSTKSDERQRRRSNQLSWFSKDNKHRLKLASELRQDGYEQDQTTNALGTFFFNSLADLQANRPAFYTRQLSPRLQSAGQTIGAISLGDSWKKSADLQFQYGVRLDGNHFSATPAFNADVQRLFGVRNDFVPNRLYVSPRLGFSWTYGEAPQIAAFDGAVRGPRAVVRGGVGVFQNTPNASSLGSAIDNTGLPGGVQQLELRRRRGADSAVGSLCVGPHEHPDAVRRRQHRQRVRQQRAQRHPVRQGLPRAPSVRGNLQWNGPILNNRFGRDRRWHVRREPEPEQLRRPELCAGRAVQPRRRRRTSGLREQHEHRAGHRRHRVARCAREPALLAREGAAGRICAATASSCASPSPDELQQQPHVVGVSTSSPTTASSRAASRAPSAIRRPSSGRAASSIRVTRSRTASATTSSTPCA